MSEDKCYLSTQQMEFYWHFFFNKVRPPSPTPFEMVIVEHEKICGH